MRLSRRQFLADSTAALGSAALAWDWGCSQDNVTDSFDPLPNPATSGIDHVIVVTMENRSFDHFLGWLPGADGRQAGVSFVDGSGVAHQTFALAPDFQGCAHRDPANSYEYGRIEYNGGACDGWLRANDMFSIGYYGKDDLPFLGAAALDWTTFDRYFCSIMAPTGPNRIYQCAGQTDRLANTGAPTTLPTIYDRLADRGIETRYFYSNVRGLYAWGDKYAAISSPIDGFYASCAAGTLPAVMFVDPPFGGSARGPTVAQDDHPFADVRAGDVFLSRVYNAVTQGPQWPRTALVITFDEWGGFFDHVAPPVAPIPDADRVAGNADGLLGFRIPTILISPFARRKFVAHTTYDHTSVLRLIEWRWDLEPLTVRDATANNLALDMDFATPNLQVPAYDVPVVAGLDCPLQA
ncbi:MAG TPA: alkaline phosphatase family protein [Gemmatimonadales bacterium]|nr:alkaline phosphatase family protein [Gemmatimonadales bacterium]